MTGRPFNSVLIANRGEIACRIIRTCRRLGIYAATIHAAADADAPHVRMADGSHLVGGATPRDSYLNIDGIAGINVIHPGRMGFVSDRKRYEAVHPGYGFLSENAEFARRCGKHLVEYTVGGSEDGEREASDWAAFIGPPPEVIEVMGDKSKARAVAMQAGVRPIPGYHKNTRDRRTLRRAAARIGYPVLVKAAAGGGGKGMKTAADEERLEEAVAAARREAQAAFGDDRVILERWLSGARHVEVQIFADHHGNCIHLFERDCSLQRRFQKVIEEAPCPALNEAQRETLGKAAVAVARQAGYRNAGTVEFLLDEDGNFYFMEMNTRLQVEHPVTEMICGLDLVEWQLRVAAGEALPLTQQQVRRRGHAIEARICAERPYEDFMPSTGTIERLQWPPGADLEAAGENGTHVRALPRIRIDSGIVEGGAITTHFDPLLAKLIVHGETREQAIAALRRALADTRIFGVRTNSVWLARLAGGARPGGWAPQQAAPKRDHFKWWNDDTVLSALAALHLEARARVSPSCCGLRLNGSSHFTFYDPHGEVIAVALDRDDDERRGTREARMQCASRRRGRDHLNAWDFAHGGGDTFSATISVGSMSGPRHVVAQVYTRPLAPGHNVVEVFSRCSGYGRGPHMDMAHLVLHTAPPPTARGAGADRDTGGRIHAPMPGRIIKVHVKRGAGVAQGEPLLVLEAMKMEHVLSAPCDGVVAELACAEGHRVEEGAELAVLAPANAEGGGDDPA